MGKIKVLNELKKWKAQGLLRPIDLHFGAFIGQLGGDNLTLLSAVFCSEYLGVGHICLPIEQIIIILKKKCMAMHTDLQTFCLRYDLSCLLQNTVQTQRCLEASICVGDRAPLSLEYNALYLRRYAKYEQIIADKLLHQPQNLFMNDVKHQLDKLFAIDFHYIYEKWLQDKAQSLPLLCEKYLDVLSTNSLSKSLDWPAIQNCFERANDALDLMPLHTLIPQNMRCDWQKVSAALAVTSARCVISGGPGTGKTTTVTKLLALLLSAQPNMIVKMVAPTGKAATRLSASIREALQVLPIDDEIKKNIPSDACTIHRLLGVKAGSNHFRFNENQRLHLDLLLIDEASMVDLPLMAKLLMALPEHARLILLGDKDQLSSVEAGAVLGDICAFIDTGYSVGKAQQLADLTGFECLRNTHIDSSGMADNCCLLQKSYRFDQYSGIGFLSNAINKGQANSEQVLALFTQYDDLAHYENNTSSQKILQEMILEGYRPYLRLMQERLSHDGPCPKVLLKAFNCFQILCAIREGNWGVQGLNQITETVLSRAGLIDKVAEQGQNLQIWYSGRPVMITQNNYHLGLYNGDIGLCLTDKQGKLRVYFEMSDGNVADFQPSRLPGHETSYAMTVHKSQGSEFEHTLLALPTKVVPVVTRELIYTGVTRAKKRLTLFANLDIMALAIKQKTLRYSRLVERLKETNRVN